MILDYKIANHATNLRVANSYSNFSKECISFKERSWKARLKVGTDIIKKLALSNVRHPVLSTTKQIMNLKKEKYGPVYVTIKIQI